MKGIVNLPAVRPIGQFAPFRSASQKNAEGKMVNTPRARTLCLGRGGSRWTENRSQISFLEASRAYAQTQRPPYPKLGTAVDQYF